jgi:GSH-dependent disulfide-bond oxidoreductase
MITLYTSPTTNGRKISIALEELELAYESVEVDLEAGDQFAEWFQAISPNSKIPAIVDSQADGYTLFESAAILQYLAEKVGRLLPTSRPERFSTLAWLSWQISGLGPMMFQLGHFPANVGGYRQQSVEYFNKEVIRLLEVLERRLSGYTFVACDEYTIADIAIFPQVFAAKTRLGDALKQSVSESPNILRWLDTVGGRSAVQRGMIVP